mgnify:CR=1 FL=1
MSGALLMLAFHMLISTTPQDTPSSMGIDLRSLDFPTARLSIEQILAHLIAEHGVQTKTSRAEALELLRGSHVT